MPLDKRYKYSVKMIAEFYLYIRDKRSGIFYVRYPDGTTLSTHETDIKKAWSIASKGAKAVRGISEKESRKNSLSKILLEYFVPNSVWLKYDIQHGLRTNDRLIQDYSYKMKVVADILGFKVKPKDVSRKMLIEIQDKLLEKGISGKTVNNYLTVIHRVFLQLLDREIIKADPFVGLRSCVGEKARRECFPLYALKGAFTGDLDRISLLAFVASVTGARRGEILRIQEGDIVTKNGTLWLNVRGTKSIYSARAVPITEYIASAIKRFCKEEYKDADFRICPQVVGQKIGFDKNFIDEHGIVFHSFRKVYKTLLTQCNLNTTLIETLMGHSTNNQASNDVERIYFVAEAADLSEIHKKVCDALLWFY